MPTAVMRNLARAQPPSFVRISQQFATSSKVAETTQCVELEVPAPIEFPSYRSCAQHHFALPVK